MRLEPGEARPEMEIRSGASGASASALAFVWKPPSSATSLGASPSRVSSATVSGSSSFSPGLPGAEAGGRMKPLRQFA